MKIDFENAKIYVRPGSTDLRKGAQKDKGFFRFSGALCL